MKIDYQNILKKNMINVLKDVLKNIEENGLKGGHHLYITFLTNHPKTLLPRWLKEKYPNEMTIVIQYEYYHLTVNEDNFSIGLSFNDVKADLVINYESIISFADPFANFGLKLINKEPLNKTIKKNTKKKPKTKKTNNVIDFKTYKKIN
tara:strand:+ start:336 stop:782 length:447 start_codon:yes stop_codon:yes gene_type:complete